MLVREGAYCFRYERRLQSLPDLEQHRLIRMVRIQEVLLEEPPLYRREWRVADVLMSGRRLRHAVDHRREVCDIWMLEQLVDRDADTFPTGPGDQLDCDDRIASEFEEVVVDAHALNAKGLSPQLCQLRFDRIASRLEAAPPHDVDIVRSGKIPAVHLAAW